MAGWAEKMNPIHNCYVGSHDLPTVQTFLQNFLADDFSYLRIAIM